MIFWKEYNLGIFPYKKLSTCVERFQPFNYKRCVKVFIIFFCNLISVTYIIIFTIFYHYYLIIIVDKGKAVKDARADFIQSMHCNNCTRVSTIGYLAGRLNSLLLLEPDNDSLNALASSKTTVPTKRKLPLSNILHKRGKWPTEWM